MQYIRTIRCCIRWIFSNNFRLWIDRIRENLYVFFNQYFRISGVEERLAREKYISDESEGIIPRATRYLWQIMA